MVMAITIQRPLGRALRLGTNAPRRSRGQPDIWHVRSYGPARGAARNHHLNQSKESIKMGKTYRQDKVFDLDPFEVKAKRMPRTRSHSGTKRISTFSVAPRKRSSDSEGSPYRGTSYAGGRRSVD